MYLDRIVATKREETAALDASFSISQALETIAGMPATKGFAKALTAGRKRDMGLIAEVKKASPSKGLIRSDFDPVAIALAYEEAGADCLSVLTDATYFQGSGEYLQAVRQAVDLPLLRKDFVIDERQIYEARLLGADAILLIAAILTPEQISSYMRTAASIGLDSLVEVHSLEEMKTVLELELTEEVLIGINNRNLHTFETSLATTETLGKLVPEGVPLISESGILSVQDMDFLRNTGAYGVLIGECFMRQKDIGAAVNALMGPVGSAAKEGGVFFS
ncbi:indole-3-glycerol phosphate synthase TrpC [Paenibacillus sp.]|jgi:indole-3-glycerol phosphate synthase|uniref:indole-3-glycerol phosphate synthase TrpC n=1 Tax=Paenibacillus sp. TaxID=58172 RepID=UPI002829E29C|nr:indole-3-glycerol phosphate synthase TrpC [Paenibacillus sp.]MDR0270319.1 indole-3-glycerol phosphate synthase TrpC [Paenibacillus sp.]